MTHTRRHRPIHIALSLLVPVLALLALASASQAKTVVDAFGFPGPEGGHVNEPRGIAINQTAAGGVAPGTIYVTESTDPAAEIESDSEGVADKESNRVQRLDPEGNFERLWGFDVNGRNEIQAVTITFGIKDHEVYQSAGGSFSLTHGADTAKFTLSNFANVALRPLSDEVQNALEALPSIGAGNVRVRGGLTAFKGRYEVEFVGDLGGTNIGQLIIDGSQIKGPAPISASVSTVQDGFGGPFAGFEICTVASECKRGITTETANGGQVNRPGGIVVNQTTGNVYVVGSNHRIDEFDANGNFIRAFGWDVIVSGGVGDVSNDAFEICTVATDCKRGVVSESGGAVGFPFSIVLDPSNHVWISEPDNHRFQEFEPDGSFIAAYGWDVDALGGSGELEKCTSTAPGACQAATVGTALGQFGANGLGSMTIDSAGFIYAVDVDNNRIQRFDPGMTSASLFSPDLFAETGLSSLGQNSSILALPGGSFLLSATTRVGENSDESRLFELDGSGQVLEASLAGDGLRRGVAGLARNEATGTTYAAVLNSGDAPGIAVIDDGPVTLPTAAIEPASGIGAEEATLNASVDPKGKPVASCGFQYSTDQVEWKVVGEPDCASLDTEGGSQPLSETVTGLEPGTHYFVRFTASRYYHNEPVLTGEVEFTTLPALPLVSDVGVAQITDTSAYLAGEIKARSPSSEYHFEYGTTPTPPLDSSTPAVGLTGSKRVVVSQQVTGLEPDTIYYLRMLATNPTGTTPSATVSFRTRPSLLSPPCENEPLREVQHATHLPECRAYEMVSPLEKNFSNADYAPPYSVVAADGGAVAFCMTTGFGEPPAQVGFECTHYRAARTPSGWRTRWFGEPYCEIDLDTTQNQAGSYYRVPFFSANLDFAAIPHSESASCSLPPLDPAAPMPQTNLYLADYRSEPVAYDLLTPQLAAGPPFILSPGGTYGAASEDWSHVVFTSSGQQTPDAPAGDFQKVFEWSEGALKLVSIDPAGNPIATDAAVPDDALHGVSADGSRIFFMAPTSESELYMRQSGAKTFDVSQSECTSGCGSSAADEFLAATPNGAKALLMSEAKLTNEDTTDNGNDLYLYTHSANPAASKNLTLLSKDSEPADGNGAKVLGLLGMSEDGETAYFVAKGQLLAGAPLEAGTKVYRWRANGGSPTLDYLATLAPPGAGPLDTPNWAGNGSSGNRSDSREVTPDGKYLLINTTARIDRGADHDLDRDVYRWSQADGWLCLSCQSPASPSAGAAAFSASSTGALGSAVAPRQYRNVISDDGQRVLFTSFDALVPADINERQDLYEWHENGTISLISTGTDITNVRFFGASKSLNDVFFTTFERLVSWDTDDSADIYDARVGGGFPEPPPTGAPCEGEACRGAPTSAPPQPGAGTAAFQGPGNVSAKGRGGQGKGHKRHHKSKGRHHKRHRAAKHNRRAAR